MNVLHRFLARNVKLTLTKKSEFHTLNSIMAKSKYEYVKQFEIKDNLIPDNYITLQLTCTNYNNLINGIKCKHKHNHQVYKLITKAAHNIIVNYKDVLLCYNYANFCTIVFYKHTKLYDRRASKLVSYLSSHICGTFVYFWRQVFSHESLVEVPIFKCCLYLIPNESLLQSYLVQEQRQCHNLNLTNTTVQSLMAVANMTENEALACVNGVTEADKNEILFTRCDINYNNEPVELKKGTLLLRSQSGLQNMASKNVLIDKAEDCNNIFKIYGDFVNSNLWKYIQSKAPNSGFHFNKVVNFDEFQIHQFLMPHSWIVVRIDGKKFHKFCEDHNFSKPNDRRALNLMNEAAKCVIADCPDVILGYGTSDEYSFVIRRYNTFKKKDGFLLISEISSVFTGCYITLWSKCFTQQPLLTIPVFDGRVVHYPTDASLLDYLRWRQVDCHINNMYNTCFWKLVQDDELSRKDAEKRLCGTFSKDKLALLKEHFGFEYSKEDIFYSKGSVLYKNEDHSSIVLEHTDIIEDEFWIKRPWLLKPKLT